MAKKKQKKTSRRGSANRPYRIVSLDGGGIRGIITAVWLDRLERELESPIKDRVDLFAGTSTGAILAAALSSGIDAYQIVELYRSRGRIVFPSAGSRLWNRALRTFTQGPSAPKYDDDGIEEVLIDQFGEGTTFGSVSRPTLIPAYDTLNRTPIVFKSFRDEYKPLKLWEVVKASASAPTYFPAHLMAPRVQETQETAEVPLIDGGVVANNPTACAIAEAIRLNGGTGLSNFRVLSFGTGNLTRPISAEEAREWGALEWVQPIIDVLMDGAGDSVTYIAQQLLPSDQYVRFQTRLNKGYDDIDDASRTNIDALIEVAERYLESDEGADAFDKAIRLLS